MKAFFSRIRLNTRFSLLILAIWVLLILILSFFIYQNSKNTLEKKAKAMMQGQLTLVNSIVEMKAKIDSLNLYQRGYVNINAVYQNLSEFVVPPSLVNQTLDNTNLLDKIKTQSESGVVKEDYFFILKQIIFKNAIFNNSDIFCVNQSGQILMHRENEGRNIADAYYFRAMLNAAPNPIKYTLKIKQKEHHIWVYYQYNKYAHCYVGLAYNTNDLFAKDLQRLQLLLLLLMSITAILTYFIFNIIIRKYIIQPTKIAVNGLKKLAKGLLVDKIEYHRKDEIGEMIDSVNTLVNGLKETATFASEIGNGNLNIEYTPLSKGDVLGNSLLNMRENLIKAKNEEEKRKIEDQKRSWATHGLAMFADILRNNNNNNLQDLSFSIIQNLVSYLKINQGGIFIVNDDNETEHFLELVSCYAYDRKKFMQRNIKVGEGLVGTCFLEQKTIYLKEIPKDYIFITSGLGSEVPSTILIVPMKVNEEIFGVIELASFNPFEKHEIEFTEKLAESIASAISNLKINNRTTMLLEKSQQQAEEMRAQEEEMRQNMEELTATQETLAEKEQMQKREIENLMTQLNDATENLRKQESQFIQLFENLVAPSFICTLDGIIEKSNFAMLALLQMNANEVIGKTIISFISGEYIYQFQQWLNQIALSKNNNTLATQEIILKTPQEQIIPANLSINFTSINRQNKYFITFNEKHQKDNTDKIKHLNEKLLQALQQIDQLQNELHAKEQDLAGKLAAINQFMFYAEFDSDANILKMNNLFASNLGYNIDDVIGKTHQLMVDDITTKTLEYQFFWNELRGGLPQTGEYKLLRKDNSEMLIYGTYSPIFNSEGKTQKVVLLAEDITIEKQQDNDLQMLINGIQKSYIYAELNNDWHIMMINDAFVNLLGYSKTEILKTNFKQLLHHQFANSEEYKDAIQEIKLGKNTSLTLQLMHADGNNITWYALISALSDAFDTHNRIYIIAYDITELHQLKRKADQYEKMAEEKTAAIKQFETQTETQLQSEIIPENIATTAIPASNEILQIYQKEINELTMLLNQVLDEAEKKYNINFNNLHNQ